MQERDRETLKRYFETDDRPSEQQFTELIESFVNKAEDGITITEAKDIGIGTTKPAAKLDVNGVLQADTVSASLVQAQDSKGLKLGHEAKEKGLFIAPDGRVGVGTDKPQAELEVHGRIRDKSGEVTPVGTVVPFAGENAPKGWLLCHGRAVNRETYADLFKVIGILYGSGNGTTTFNLPDLRGRVPVGLDSSQSQFSIVGTSGGAKTHTLTLSELPTHTHTYEDHHGSPVRKGQPADAGTGPTRKNFDTSPVGGGEAHNNLQPYLVLNYIIKY